MRIPRIYTGQALAAKAEIALEAGPSQHLARALRMKVGDALILFNGAGGEYPAIISALDKKSVHISCSEFVAIERESDLRLHLGIALSRGDRMDWVVQKATELGVVAIIRLLKELTQGRLNSERGEKKLKHWQQIAISACEQCGRNQLPLIHPLQSLASWVHGVQADSLLVLHHRAMNTGSNPPIPKPESIALLVGPEGGLDPAEISAAETAGFSSLQLGPRVLRTETAPLAAIAILQAHWGDMGQALMQVPE